MLSAGCGRDQDQRDPDEACALLARAATESTSHVCALEIVSRSRSASEYARNVEKTACEATSSADAIRRAHTNRAPPSWSNSCRTRWRITDKFSGAVSRNASCTRGLT